MKKPSPPTRAANMLSAAIVKTDKVQDELNDAVQDLNHANAVLTNTLSTAQAVAAVAGAVEQNLAAETKVHDAAEELESVKDLIKQAQHAQAQDGEAGNAGEGTASLLPHLEVQRRSQARGQGGEPRAAEA